VVSQGAVFEKMWSTIADIGRDPVTGGYRRFAWTAADLSMREWFAGDAVVGASIWLKIGWAISGPGGVIPTAR
jgi:hypothetical protein